MLKAVLFDLDNTLIDFMSMKRKCCSAAVSAMVKEGLKMPRRKALDILFELYIFERFLRKVNGKVDYKILSAGIAAYRNKQPRYMRPYPAVVPVLRWLRSRGLKLAIVSDAPRLKAWMRLRELGIASYFDAVVAFGDVKVRKPAKMPFRKALSELGVKPSEALMVGDNPKRDMIGAKRLGIKTCFARYGYNFVGRPIKGMDYTIDRIGELRRVVEER
jgi:putative hydrolase of the HAD superfamily